MSYLIVAAIVIAVLSAAGDDGKHPKDPTKW